MYWGFPHTLEANTDNKPSNETQNVPSAPLFTSFKLSFLSCNPRNKFIASDRYTKEPQCRKVIKKKLGYFQGFCSGVAEEAILLG
jgi:hypothetical protein